MFTCVCDEARLSTVGRMTDKQSTRTYSTAQGTLLNTVITHVGKESKKEWIHVYVYLSHFVV